MSTVLYPGLRNSKTLKFIPKTIGIPSDGLASTELMESYLKYVFNPLSGNVDSGFCRNIDIFDCEPLAQVPLGCQGKYRDPVTFLKYENSFPNTLGSRVSRKVSEACSDMEMTASDFEG